MPNDKLNLLLWNTYKKPLFEELKSVVDEHSINFLIVLENTGNESEHLKNLGSSFKHYRSIIFNKAKIFSNLSVEIREIHGHGRYGFYRITGSDFEEILLVIVHFPSKVNWGDSSDHFGLCVELKRDIELKETELGHDRTIIVGDFNMNPFEDGLINASGLNNTNSVEIAKTGFRKVLEKDYKFFYNPMWNFFGDFSKGDTPGTHYFNTYKYLNLYWNIYDQIMLRPSLINGFDEKNLEVLTSSKDKHFTKMIRNITRVNKEFSDHLPVKLSLNLN